MMGRLKDFERWSTSRFSWLDPIAFTMRKVSHRNITFSVFYHHSLHLSFVNHEVFAQSKIYLDETFGMMCVDWKSWFGAGLRKWMVGGGEGGGQDPLIINWLRCCRKRRVWNWKFLWLPFFQKYGRKVQANFLVQLTFDVAPMKISSWISFGQNT